MAKVELMVVCALLLVVTKRSGAVGCPTIELNNIGCYCNPTRVICNYKGPRLTYFPTFVSDTVTFVQAGFNSITEIDSEDFKGLKNLEHLNLRDNKITKVLNGTFRILENLVLLSLSGNIITEIEKDAFEGLKNLKVLFLYDNKITKVFTDTFKYLGSLQELYLHDNKITQVSTDTFKYLGSLQILYLYNNNITQVSTDIFKYLGSLQILYLHDNPIQCCQSFWLIDFGKNLPTFSLECFDFNERVPYTSFNSTRCPCKIAGGVCKAEMSSCTNTLDAGCKQDHHICCKIARSNNKKEKEED